MQPWRGLIASLKAVLQASRSFTRNSNDLHEAREKVAALGNQLSGLTTERMLAETNLSAAIERADIDEVVRWQTRLPAIRSIIETLNNQYERGRADLQFRTQQAGSDESNLERRRGEILKEHLSTLRALI